MEEKGLALVIEEATDSAEAQEKAYHHYLWPVLKPLLPKRQGLNVLDAGCGFGYLTAQLAALGHLVTGVDYRPRKIETARAAYPEARFELASVYDSLTAWMPRGGWDVAIATEVIEHLYSPQAFLRNMHRHLKPGGFLILSTPYHGYLKNLAICVLNRWDKHHWVNCEGGHVKFFSVATLGEALRGAGFGGLLVRHAGGLPGLWKSMVCRACKQVRPARA